MEGDKLDEPLFTPATKAETGHDENMTPQQVEDMVGRDVAERLAETTKAIYSFAHDFALEKGIIIADTKMEFGYIDGQLTLIDELLTPDSSRFWDASGYSPGKSQPNFDKQFVRDWLLAQDWDREPPAPELPEDIVQSTRRRYIDVSQRLMARSIS